MMTDGRKEHKKLMAHMHNNSGILRSTQRPNYVFSIRDAKSEAPVTPDVIGDTEYATKDENGVWHTSDGERLYTHSEAVAAISNAIDDTQYYSYDDMSAEYYLR